MHTEIATALTNLLAKAHEVFPTDLHHNVTLVNGKPTLHVATPKAWLKLPIDEWVMRNADIALKELKTTNGY